MMWDGHTREMLWSYVEKLIGDAGRVKTQSVNNKPAINKNWVKQCLQSNFFFSATVILAKFVFEFHIVLIRNSVWATV